MWIVKTPDKLISRIEGCRSREEISQLWLSFVNVHKPIVSLFISDWFRNVLREIEIDLNS